MLAPKLITRSSDDGPGFFDQYQGCVFSCRNAPRIDQLRGSINLSLEGLRRRGGAGADIFRAFRGAGADIFRGARADIFRAFFAVKSAFPMGCNMRRRNLYEKPQGGAYIAGIIPVPCCYPSAVERIHRRTLGPVQTL
jgi:hypothetical protein